MAQYTPMIKQYLEIKDNHKDAFLFFRLGDFYEMFFEDAIKAAQELEITLTKRDGGEEIPMCGVPYHSASTYIKKLIDKGYKVAICEQVEDPKLAKGVVKREVIQVITPGTVMEGNLLNEKENNYIASITPIDHDRFVIAYNDLSTGENSVALIQDGWDSVLSELFNRPVKEVVVPSNLDESLKQVLREQLSLTLSFEDEVVVPNDYKYLTSNLEDPKLVLGFGRLFQYIKKTQMRSLTHLQAVTYIELNEFLKLDMYSKRNLELTETIRNKGKHGSLLWVLDRTVTAMGARTMKKWLDRPLLSKEAIEKRHRLVSALMEQFFERESLRESLKEVYDLERLSGRVAFGNVNARDMLQLKRSLLQVPKIMEILKSFGNEWKEFAEAINPLEEVARLLENSVHDDPPISIKEGGIIKDDFNQTLDQYRLASRNGKQWIAELEQKEKQESGIKSLKIGYNKVFGYYIEVTKANLHLIPEGRYERKQTLSNAERFITPELKEKEALILEAQEKSEELEYEIFNDLREQVKRYIPDLQTLASLISQVDVLQSFAEVSDQNQYEKPMFTNGKQLEIIGGRHPVVEKVMKQETFVPNDIKMDETNNILLITGPNMSGKSTYMRQLALTVIMGQIGCFVPCESAKLPVFDQIFTRIGAADDLVAGQSTFMVEMLEANHAITKATKNSLILLDEIGRGTSTYDGMSLAQAIVEYIHNEIQAKTLFSTHYHELTALDKTLVNLTNIHVKAVEQDGNVVFLHKIHEGPADQSYGIHVAKLAQLPEKLIARAYEILQQFESDQASVHETEKNHDQQLSFFMETNDDYKNKSINENERTIIKVIKELNLLEMTPMDAMNKLFELQKKMK